MSERGSFTTEYVYCEKCFAAIKEILLSNEKSLCSTIIPSWCKQEIPIIAGKIGSLVIGGEFLTFEMEIIPQLEEVICHDMRIAVLSDSGGDKIFNIKPKG